MDLALWITVGLVSVTVALAVLTVAAIWEELGRRRGWRETRRTLWRVTGRPDPASAATTPVTVLREEEAPDPGWIGWLGRRVRLFAAVDRLIDQAESPWGLGGFLIRAAGTGAGSGLAVLLVTRRPAAFVAGFAIGALLPYIQLRRARARRLKRFEEQFPDAIDLLMRSVRAGHPFTAGLRMVAMESSEPLAGEFRRVFEEQRFGLPVSESLQRLAARVDLLDVRIFVTAVIIQREVGGNLAEILASISETIRERFKIQRQVQVFTAQGRLTGILLSVLPFAMGLIMLVINADYMRVLFSDPLGQLMLGFALTLQVIGYMIIRKITEIEI